MGMLIQHEDALNFINKHCTSMKILHIEWRGLVMYDMKLSQGQFALPTIDFKDGKTVSHTTLRSDLALMVQGIDMQQVKHKKRFDSADRTNAL